MALLWDEPLTKQTFFICYLLFSHRSETAILSAVQYCPTDALEGVVTVCSNAAAFVQAAGL